MPLPKQDYTSNAAAQPKAAPQQKKYVKKVVKKRVVKLNRSKLYAIVRVLFVCAIAMVLCARYVRWYDLHTEIIQKERILEEITGLNKQIENSIESGVNLGSVEKYATEILDMSKAQPHQIVKIETAASDTMRSHATKELKAYSLWDRVSAVIDSIVAYFN